MGQMKETLHDNPDLVAYEEHTSRLAAMNTLAADLLNEVSNLQFTLRVLQDAVVEFYKEINK